MNMQNKRKTVLLILFLLFFFSFFHRYFTVANYFFMGAVIITTWATNSFKEKVSVFRQGKHIWFMLAFFMVLIFSFLASQNKEDGLHFLLRRMPLLLFPLSIGLIQLTRELRDRVLFGLAIIVTIACMVSLGWAIYRSIEENNPAWLYNDALSYFIGQQSIYTSVFVNISIYIFVYFILYYRPSLLKKIGISSAILFLLIISYLLASRNMMLMLYIMIILFSIYIVIKRKKITEGIALLSVITAGVFIIFLFFPKTINRFRELAFTEFNFESKGKESHYNMEITPDQWNGANFRLAAWRCGWELFQEHPVMGVGLGDKKDELFQVYAEKKFQFAINTKKNVHNNYLDILISTGLIGLFLFLIGWVILPFIRVVKNQDGLGVLILLTFFLAMLTENYFDRSLGVMLFAFFIPFILAGSLLKR